VGSSSDDDDDDDESLVILLFLVLFLGPFWIVSMICIFKLGFFQFFGLSVCRWKDWICGWLVCLH
jgi:hypothetical protein